MFGMEDFVDKNRNIIAELDCCYAHTYKSLAVFRFLPAHRLLILRLPFYVNKIFGTHQATNTQQHQIISTAARNDTSDYSFLLNRLIESAEDTAGAPKNRYRYSETLRLFSTYIFLCSGRSCYEILSSNLPIPSKHTVCKYQTTYLFFNYTHKLMIRILI